MNRKHLLLITTISFFYLTIFFSQGVDVTDAGYSLTREWRANEESQYDMLAGAMLLGGAWLKLYGSPNMFWGRIGAALIYSITLFFILSITTRYFKKNAIELTLLSFLVLTASIANIPHYNNISALFLFSSIFFIMNGMETKKTRIEKTSFFFSGVSIAIAVFCRFPLIICFLTPVIVYLCQDRLFKIKKEKSDTLLLFFFLGASVTLIILFAYLFLSGTIETYIQNIFGFILATSSNKIATHTPVHLVYKLFQGYLVAFILLSLLALYSIYLSHIKKRLKLGMGENFAEIITYGPILLAVPIVYLIGFEKIFLDNHHNFILVAITFFGLGLLAFKRSSIREEIKLISVISLFFFLVHPLGSNNGLLMANYSLFLLLPFSLLIVNEIGLKKNTSLELSFSLKKTFKILIIFLIFLFLILSYMGTYRDSSNRIKLVHPVGVKGFENIYTTESRAETLTELFDKLESMDLKEKEILCANNIPLVHFITETKPFLNNPWPFLMTPEQFNQSLKENIQKKGLPEHIILSEINTRERTWPSEKSKSFSSEKQKEDYQLVKNLIKKSHYKKEWENQHFTIYSIE